MITMPSILRGPQKRPNSEEHAFACCDGRETVTWSRLCWQLWLKMGVGVPKEDAKYIIDRTSPLSRITCGASHQYLAVTTPTSSKSPSGLRRGATGPPSEKREEQRIQPRLAAEVCRLVLPSTRFDGDPFSAFPPGKTPGGSIQVLHDAEKLPHRRQRLVWPHCLALPRGHRRVGRWDALPLAWLHRRDGGGGQASGAANAARPVLPTRRR